MVVTSKKDNRALLGRLRGAGYKATKSRVAVLGILEKNRKPLSVQKIMQALKGSTIDQATVYRTLNTLTRAEMVRRVDLEHGHAHYELRDESDHHHVVCTICHRIEDVNDCDLRTMTRQALRQSQFAEISRHSLEFFGVCRGCRQRSRAASTLPRQ